MSVDEKPAVKEDEEVSNNNAVDEKTEKTKTSNNTVTIHVSGAKYELDLDDIRRAQSSRLYKCVFLGNSTSLTFKRPIHSFEAVLAYYQTGELHMPTCACPGAFKSELEFWGIDPQIMSSCCYYRFISHLDDQETLDRFHNHLFPDVGLEKRPLRWAKAMRTKMWRVLDNLDNSFITKLYFYICTAMVILSVMTLAFSTLPYFRRNLTKCEMEEMLGEPVRTLNYTFSNSSCADPLPDDVYASIIVDYEKIRLKNETELEQGDIVVRQSAVAKADQKKNASRKGDQNPNQPRTLFDFNFDEQDTVSDDQFIDHIYETLRPRLGIGKKTVRVKILTYLDTAILAFFTADLLLRVFSCPSIRRYFLSTINVIDALVVLSSHAHMAVNFLKSSEKYESTGFDILEIFQVLRVVRLLRVVRNVTGFKVLTFSLKVSMKDLLVLFLYLLLGIAIFANFIFFVESDNEIQSIPAGWWWAINTLTTVGYGDMVPYTMYGRLIGAMCAISGVVMMAVAIPVFVKTFMLLYAYAVLYKKAIHRPEDTHQYIHRKGAIKRPDI